MKRKINKVIKLTKIVFKIVDRQMPDKLNWFKIDNNIKVYRTEASDTWSLSILDIISISTLKHAETIEFNYLKANEHLDKTIELLETFINLNKI